MSTPRNVQKEFSSGSGSEAGFNRLRAAIRRKERVARVVRVIAAAGAGVIFFWLLNSI